MNNIDFVLPWVDGSDKEWLALKCKYESSMEVLPSNDPESNSDCRYRDYGLLKYWFRGVERFAPWVNRVFFVTCGQKPDWLDESNPKLRLVDHKEYIPSDYLPTFQSNTIELNLHRIPDLSEHFVLFNDDTFLLRPIKPDFYFKKGLPVIPCDIGIPHWLGYNHTSRVVINNSGILNQTLDVRHLVWKNIWKFANVHELGFMCATKNVLSFAINRMVIPGSFGHMSQSHLKSTFDEIWHMRPEVMDITSRNRFRCDNCVNHWLACAWNMTSGRFCPANEKKRAFFSEIVANKLPKICDVIHHQSFPQICIGERKCDAELYNCIDEIIKVFEQLFQEKSSFEK